MQVAGGVLVAFVACATVVAAAIARGSLFGVPSGGFVAAWVVMCLVLFGVALALRELWTRRRRFAEWPQLQHLAQRVAATVAVVGYVAAAVLLLWHPECADSRCYDPAGLASESADEALCVMRDAYLRCGWCAHSLCDDAGSGVPFFSRARALRR